jgi:magnesium transporter
MIEVLKNINGKLVEIDKPQKKSWINLVSPTEQDIEQLRTIIDLPEDILESVRDKDEVPSIEEYGDLLFVLVRIPQKNTDLTEYSTVPLGIIRTKDYMITICYFENEIIDLFKEKNVDITKRRISGLNILLTSAEIYLKYLKEINKKIYGIRKEIGISLKNTRLIKLLDIEKSLIYFDTSLESNKKLIEKMRKDNIFKKEHASLINDVLEEYNQAIEMTKIYSGILVRMMDSFSSVISNNLNATMRFLTSITLILMVPTLISSIYGMNIGLPFQTDPNAFAIILLVSIVLSVLGIILFWRTDLL